jgi:2'-5' RNA ligase
MGLYVKCPAEFVLFLYLCCVHPNLRLFIAVPLPPAFMAELQAFRQANAALMRISGFRWTPEINLHLTALFIGETPPALLSQLRQGLSGVAEVVSPFTIAFDGCAYAPNASRPRMVWAKFQNNDGYNALAAELQIMALQTFPTYVGDTREPRPHITLARFAEGKKVPPLVSTPFETQTLPVQQIELWQSTLKLSGAEYRCLNVFPLQGNTIE